ncbi:leucine-rich repeat flightless-interacting protein 2 isoform X1 [Anguilla anguilla]|uniref:leucine-rich repeat flightless-interacting protein 2 isoform X1 n=1 Tax=Anguilla anguilla TaxID=7936 RepID=UPI0015ACBE8E|nr:leucine-rich repeat flightless-interacting protein 2 isoform X1 [Anguilla anguilla]
MGTPGSGRKRAPVKDRFSAEDEALSSIAREAEARLAAKRAARAEARDIRMRELERQQKEHSHHHSSSSSSGRKWGQIHQWMADTEKARHSHKSSNHHHRALDDDVKSVRSVGNYRSSSSSSLRDTSSSHRSRASTSRRRDLLSDSLPSTSSLRPSRSSSSVYSDLYGLKKTPVSSTSRKDLLTGLFHDQRKYSSLQNSKPVSAYQPRACPPLPSLPSYQPRSSSVYNEPLGTSRSHRATPPSGTGLTRSQSLASLYDDDLYGSYNSRTPSEYSWASGTSSSTQSSPVSSDDDSSSTVSQDRYSRGRRDSVSSDFSDISETAADYFSRSNRRGSIVSDLDELSIPDLDSLDEKCDKQYTDTYSRPSSRCTTPALSTAALATLGGSTSRRGSGDTGSIADPDASLTELRDIYDLKDQIQDVEGRYMQGLKELKESLSEVEEKYKKAMVSNAQLDNEKANLLYQVDTLKDVIEEMEEQMAELHREVEEKSKELERHKHTCTVLQHKQEELKEGIRQRDELIEENQAMRQQLDSLTRQVFDLQETVNWKEKKIGALERQKEYFDCIRSERDELRDELADLKGKSKTGEKHGLVIIPEDTPNGDVSQEAIGGSITVVSQEAAQVLESAGEGPLDVRLRKLADEKDELLAQIRKLKTQLEDERQKSSKMESVFTDGERMENGTDLHLIELQRDTNRQISEYKFKLSKAEQEMGTMEQNITRLEGQVSRYKASADNSEKVEDELKVEKRKLQRELRTALDKIEEMEMTNSHLVKRLEKMKANRNALLTQQ